jgi:hypothetical protein
VIKKKKQIVIASEDKYNDRRRKLRERKLEGQKT